MTLSRKAYRLLVDAGLCARCGRKPEPGRKECARCLKQNREAVAASRARAAGKPDPRPHCPHCGRLTLKR